MRKAREAIPELNSESNSAVFVPSEEQTDALARRLMPEIKKYLSNEQIQQEFAQWKGKQDSTK